MMSFEFKLSKTRIALIVAASVLFSGCAAYQDKRDIDNLVTTTSAESDSHIQDFTAKVKLDAKRAAQIVDKPYLAGKARPLAREATLPLVLQGKVDVTLLYSGDANLVTLASRITDATGIPVKVTPDALLPQEDFLPRLEKNDQNDSALAVPSLSTASFDPMQLRGIDLDAALRDSGPVGLEVALQQSGKTHVKLPKGKQYLPQVLDAIALKLGVYWKYDDAIGALVFYRTETRSFEVRGVDISPSAKLAIGIDGSVDGESSSNGFNSTSSTTLEMQADKEGSLAPVIRRVEQYMTRSGKVVVGAGGLIVVTDAKGSLDQIEKLVAEENRVRTRRIDFVLEEITIEKSSSAQAGVNFNLAFNSGGQANSFDVNGLNSLLEQEGAALSLGGAVGSGPWKGSSIATQALAKIGRVVDKKINVFSSLNGMPATAGRPGRLTYINKMEQTPGYADNSEPTVTVTQAEVVFGRVLTIVPRAYGDGTVDVALKYDNTPDPVLQTQKFNKGGYVQSPTTLSDTIVVNSSLKSGQPFVVTAFSSKKDQYDARRVDPDAPMIVGGSDVTDRTERVTVLVLTPRVRE